MKISWVRVQIMLGIGLNRDKLKRVNRDIAKADLTTSK